MMEERGTMNENVNPDNVNPHFDHPEQFGLYPPTAVQPCPSCGHCPTCERGPSYQFYQGPIWPYIPNQVVYCSGITSGGMPTVTLNA